MGSTPYRSDLTMHLQVIDAFAATTLLQTAAARLSCIHRKTAQYLTAVRRVLLPGATIVQIRLLNAGNPD
jgi:hypothetical protein